MKPGTHVRISRQWHNPAIAIEITAQGIGITMPLEDFVKALAAEVGRPIGILTRQQLLEQLEAAAERVTDSMKRETTPVVGQG